MEREAVLNGEDFAVEFEDEGGRSLCEAPSVFSTRGSLCILGSSGLSASNSCFRGCCGNSRGCPSLTGVIGSASSLAVSSSSSIITESGIASDVRKNDDGSSWQGSGRIDKGSGL